MKKILRILALIVVPSVMVVCVLSSQVMAAGVDVVWDEANYGSNTVFKKALLQGLYRCYNTSGVIEPSWNVNDSKMLLSDRYYVKDNTDKYYVMLPNSMTKVEAAAVSCQQLIYGYGNFGTAYWGAEGLTPKEDSFSGILNLAEKEGYIQDSKSYDVSAATRTDFLKSVGYKDENTQGDSDDGKVIKCAEIAYNAGIEGTKSYDICFEVWSGGQNRGKIANIVTDTGLTTMPIGVANPIGIKIGDSGKTFSFIKAVKIENSDNYSCRSKKEDDVQEIGVAFSVGMEFETLMERLNDADLRSTLLRGSSDSKGSMICSGTFTQFLVGMNDKWVEKDSTVDTGSLNSKKLVFDKENGYVAAIKTLSGGAYTSLNDIYFNESEVRVLYGNYLKIVYGVLIKDSYKNGTYQIGEDAIIDYTRLTDEQKTFIENDESYSEFVPGKWYILTKPKRNQDVVVNDVSPVDENKFYGAEGGLYYFGENKQGNWLNYVDLVKKYAQFLDSELGVLNKEKCLSQYEEQLRTLEKTYEEVSEFNSVFGFYSMRFNDVVDTLGDKVLLYIDDDTTPDDILESLIYLKSRLLSSKVAGKTLINPEILDLEVVTDLLADVLGAIKLDSQGEVISGWPDEETMESLRRISDVIYAYHKGLAEEFVGPLKALIERAQKAYDEKKDVDGEIYDRTGECPGLDKYIKPIRDLLEENDISVEGINTDWNPVDVEDIIDQGEAGKQNTDTEKVCKDGSGVIGWLVCPLVTMISGIGNRMWISIEKNFMIIPTEIFDSNKGVSAAWGVIRDIGNVIFIILFLVVIFSQLTGVGIDNYGIKKILPRLIMVAILANLSWIICELAADVSNIVGSGIGDMLAGFARDIATVGGSSPNTVQMVTAGIGTAALGGGALALFVLANGWNLAGVAALGLAVLGIVIVLVAGIITMYLILIIREAGIILAIVLAPVAIVCYALPNTEKLAKKWLDLFKALLIVYPLCGAAIGAGKLASAVLASIAGGDETLTVIGAISGGNLVELINSIFAAASMGQTGLMFAAMVVQVLPFFFIPTLLRNSLSLMGNIGARISQAGRNLGRRASTGLQRGVQNSERFKDFQKYQQDQTAMRRALRVKNRYTDNNGEKLAGLTRREEDRLAKAQDFISAENQRRARAHVGVFGLSEELAINRAQSSRDAQEFKASQEEFAGYDQTRLREVANTASEWLENPNGQQRMSALIGAMEANGMQKDIYTMLRNNPSVGNKTSVMQSLANSKDKVLKAYGKKGAGMSYSDFMSKAVYKDASGNYTTDASKAASGTTAVASSMIAQYISDKGSDFINDLDDKSLGAILQDNGGEAMSTGLLMEAAARINSQDAVNEIDKMLQSRSRAEIAKNISAEQLARMNDSTFYALQGMVGMDSDMADAMLRASEAIAKSPELASRFSDERKSYINNNIRRGMPPIV